MQADDHIRQEQLAAELSTSVVPVREALKTLEAEGLDTYIPYRGFQVTRLSIDDLHETYEIRRLLEDEIVSIAAPRLTDQHFDALGATMTAMPDASRAGDVTIMIAGNHELHFTIFEAAAALEWSSSSVFSGSPQMPTELCTTQRQSRVSESTTSTAGS